MNLQDYTPSQSCFGLRPHSVRSQHVEPPFWWADFNHNELQLMIHGENISQLNPKISFKGIKIQKVHKVDSPNYLFLDLVLKKNKSVPKKP